MIDGEEVRPASGRRRRRRGQTLTANGDDDRHGGEHGQAGPVAPPPEDQPQLRPEEPGAGPAAAGPAPRAAGRPCQPLTSKPSPVSDTNISSRSGATTREAAHRRRRRAPARPRPSPARRRPSSPVTSCPRTVDLGQAQLPQHPRGVLGPVGLDPDPRRGLGPQPGQRRLGHQPAQVHHARRGCRSAPPRRAGGWRASRSCPSAASAVISAAHLAGALRVQPVGRLVQDQQLPRREQGGGEGQPLAHAQRVRPVPLAGRGEQPDPLQRRVDPRPGGGRVGGAVGRVQPGAGWPARTGTGGTPAPRPGRRPGAAPRRPRPASARPSSSCAPAVGRIRPSSIRIVVVLPDPFGPRNPYTAPRGTARSIAVDRDLPAEPLGQPALAIAIPSPWWPSRRQSASAAGSAAASYEPLPARPRRPAAGRRR